MRSIQKSVRRLFGATRSSEISLVPQLVEARLTLPFWEHLEKDFHRDDLKKIDLGPSYDLDYANNSSVLSEGFVVSPLTCAKSCNCALVTAL
jgi:hypothetical protein